MNGKNKKIVLIIDPQTWASETIELSPMAINIATTMEQLSHTNPQNRSTGALKQDILEFMVSCLRPEVIGLASNMEVKLRIHDKERGDTWKNLNPQEALIQLLGKVDDLKSDIVCEESPIRVSSDGADIANFAMFITENYQRNYRGYQCQLPLKD